MSEKAPAANEFRYLLSRLLRIADQAPHLPRTFSLVWKAAPGWTATWIALLVCQGILPIAIVYLTRSVVNSLMTAIRSHGSPADLRAAAVWIAALGLVLLASEMLLSLTSWVRTAQSEILQDYITRLIHEKSAAVDLAFYDLSKHHDELYRARAEAQYRPAALLANFGSLFQNGITLIAMLAVLIPFNPWLPLILLASSVPALAVAIRYAALQHDLRLRTTVDERRSWYYDWLLTDRETAAEVRLFDTAASFGATYQSLRAGLRRQRIAMARRQAIAEFTAGGAALCLSAGCLGWMGLRAVRGEVTLGDLALFYQAFQQGLRLMRSLLEGIGQIYLNSLFLGNLYEFLGLESTLKEPEVPAPAPSMTRGGIRFRNVSFRYPDMDTYALRNFDLHIPAGQVAAILGPNGVGKSTLIKLICRFYDPDEGVVEIDGRNVREFSTVELRKKISVLFQEPVHYSATVSENIAIGEQVGANREEIEAAVTAAGAERISRRLKDGYNSLLGRWFDSGTELSVGEWQCIALARAYFRKSPILVLDEPTSALDPWAEADWLSRFRRLAKGRTAIVITHRFSTAMAADRIYVMAEGQVIEAGTHQELAAAGGRYAEGWHAQKSGGRSADQGPA